MNYFGLNLVKVFFSLLTFSIVFIGSLINMFETYIPAFIKQTFLYGKFAYSGKQAFMKPIQVPKSWFRHFYIHAVILMAYTFYITVRSYIFGSPAPPWFLDTLDNLVAFRGRPTVNCSVVMLAIVLLAIQVARRFYDTHFVSVFGENSKMDLTHYFVGFTHYTGCVAAILGEAPVFNLVMPGKPSFTVSDLSIPDILAASIFLWACLHQYRANVILGNLRRDKKGVPISSAYKIPRGDWFEYVSCPHQLAEIVMYVMLAVILRNNSTWYYVTAWVISNQVETALLSHWWYLRTFKDYPSTRKALFPYLY